MGRREAIRDFGLTLMLLCVTALWGWTFKVVHDVVKLYGVFGFLAVRFAMATAVLAPVSARRLSWRTLGTGLSIGVVLGVAYVFQTGGLKFTQPTNSGLITGLFIVFVPVFDRLLFGIHIRRLFWAAVAASLAGMVLLTIQGPPDLRTGDMLTVAAAAAFGLHISLLSRHSPRHDCGALTMAQMLAVAMVTAAAWPFAEPLRLPPREAWWALIVTALLASAAAFYVQTFVQSRLPALRTGIIITTEPMFAVLFGYLLAGDRLTGLQIVGAGLMLSAIVLGEVVPALRKARVRPGPNRVTG